MNKMILFFIVFIIIITIPIFSCAQEYEEFTDTSGVGDDVFFGVWDSSSDSWTIPAQLDYAKHGGLGKVESAAKSGDYTKAKEELLRYYKQREGIVFPSTPQSGSSANTNFWSLRDSMAFTDSYITDIDITSAEFTEYEIDLGNNANSGRFLLSSLQKSSDMIEITSRESGKPAKLVIECTNGETVVIDAEKDTYIRAGAYKTQNFGSESSLYIKDDYTLSGGKYLPFSDNTRRSYVFFDNDKIPSSGIKSVKLVINARLIGESGEATEKSINLVVVNPYNKSWSESADSAGLKAMTWANYKIAHYSWQGLPGGILWEKPDNVPSEFFNANTRFSQMSSLASLACSQTDKTMRDYYMHKSMELTLDFIEDTKGKISNGIPNKRDIESANRCQEFASLYGLYLGSGFMTPDANVAMLKWLYQEARYLYYGAGILYTGANAEVTENNYANTNRGTWHTMGFLACVGYFPEFKGNSSWENVLNARINKMVNVIIADDGCYLEPTFGYPGAVINFFNSMMKTWHNTGKTPDETVSSKIKLLARYLMYTGYPDGNPPRWGESFGNARTTIKSISDYADDPEVVYYVTGGLDGTPPEKNYAKFDLLKVVTDRTGWSSADSMIFMNAKNGGNHNHKDSLSLTMYYDGREILEDTGMTSYDGGYPSFDWQRHQTKSHNTVEIDGKPQRGSNFLDDNGDSDISIRSNSLSSFISGWTDATEGFRHRRNVMWLKNHGLAVVNDSILAPDTEEHTYAQNWHVYSKYSAYPYIEADLTGRTNYESGTQLIISQADKADMSAGLEKGYSAISSDMTDYFSYKKTVSGNGSFSTVLAPKAQTDEIKVDSSVIPVSGSDAKASEISFEKNGRAYTIIAYTSYEEKPVLTSFGTMSSDCSSAYAIYDEKGRVSEAAIYNGKGLYSEGKTIFASEMHIDNASAAADNGKLMIQCPAEYEESGFVLSGFGDINGAYVNGRQAELSLLGDCVYVNYGISVSEEAGGLIGNGRFLWGYDATSGVLRIHGSGELNVYTQDNYTDRPWQEYADEVEYLVLDSGITSVDMHTFSHMPLINKVWCSGEMFKNAGDEYTIKSAFAGTCAYICSSGKATDGIYIRSWEYEPGFSDGLPVAGILSVTAISEDDRMNSVSDGGWGHLDYHTLYLSGMHTVGYPFESEALERVYISDVSAIGGNAFYNCPALKDVVIAEGLERIESGAFGISGSRMCSIDVNLPASLVSAGDIFKGRNSEHIQLYGYPGTEAESFAKENSLRFEYITSGGKEGLYTWSYDEDKAYLTVDFDGEIPAKLTELHKGISDTYEPYASLASTLYLGENVTGVSAGLFDGGNIQKVYCPHGMFELTYKQAADVGDALYKDENGNEVVYPAYVVLGGKTVPTHNANISGHIASPFAGDAEYKAANGTFVSYSKTSSPFTIAVNGVFEWKYDPVSGRLSLECTAGDSVGNTSVRTRSYYPWRDVVKEVKSIEFIGDDIHHIGKYAFSDTAIEELTLPDSLTNINMRAFQNCRSLLNVEFGSGIVKLANYAFMNCSSLETVFVPDSVSAIEAGVFRGTGAEVICNVGSYAASFEFYDSDSVKNKKRVLSKIGYENGNIQILCGSDNKDKLIKAYYIRGEDGTPELVKAVVDDVSLIGGEYITLADKLEDAECDFVKLLLARGDNMVCPDSRSIEVEK